MANFEFQFYVGGPAFHLDDLVISRKADYDQRSFKTVLYEILGRVTDVSREGQVTISIYKGAELLPKFGKDMTFTRFGNVTNPARQGSIFITSDDLFNDNNFDSPGSAPYIDIRDGVDSYTSRDDLSTLKFRAGNLDGIIDPDFGSYQPEGYGVYTTNFYGKGTFILGAGSAGFNLLSDAPHSIAELDGTYGPLFQDAPGQSGLFINASRMGYYNANVLEGETEPVGWMTYMDAGGGFYLRGKTTDEASLTWGPGGFGGGSSLQLKNARLDSTSIVDYGATGMQVTTYSLTGGSLTLGNTVFDDREQTAYYQGAGVGLGIFGVDWNFEWTDPDPEQCYDFSASISYAVDFGLGLILTLNAAEVTASGDGTFGGYSVTALGEAVQTSAEDIGTLFGYYDSHNNRIFATEQDIADHESRIAALEAAMAGKSNTDHQHWSIQGTNNEAYEYTGTVWQMV